VIGLVIVSHSAKLAQGVQELAAQMAGEEVGISQAGGLSDDCETFGTDTLKILSAIEEVWCEDGVLLLMDVGSAVMSAELALEMLPEEQRRNCLLSNAPLVEGAIVAAFHASLGEPLQAVNALAEAALSTPKLG
jgi:phosphocarrier protein FPr